MIARRVPGFIVVTHIISVLGGVLPALGIGMLMNIVIKDKMQLIFFLAGFVLLSFAGLSMVAIVFIAALVAYLVFLSSGKSSAEPVAEAAAQADAHAVYEDEDLF